VELACTPFAGGMYCEAWPQADGQLHYAWTVRGIALDYTPEPGSAAIYANCSYGQRGTITVTVISPGFASGSATTGETCGDF
jgi:hypothetical protein